MEIIVMVPLNSIKEFTTFLGKLILQIYIIESGGQSNIFDLSCYVHKQLLGYA